MELSEKTLQELKEKRLSIEDLDDRYFIEFRSSFEMNNILKLLNEKICSFQQIVDKFKSIKDRKNNLRLYVLLRNKEFFEELIKNNVLNKEDIRYLLNKIDNDYELRCLSRNTILLKYIVDKNIASFKELVDKSKSINYTYDRSCLYKLLENKKLFQELIETSRLNKDDLEYLLNKIDDGFELDELCWNTALTKYILNEFILNKELVDRLNRIVENDGWRKNHSLHTIFGYIEFHAVHRWNRDEREYCRKSEIDQELLELNELNEKAYLLNNFDLNRDQKLELIELIQNNEIAQNRLIQIADNHVESNYDFDSLMSYLKKTEKKNLINI